MTVRKWALKGELLAKVQAIILSVFALWVKMLDCLGKSIADHLVITVVLQPAPDTTSHEPTKQPGRSNQVAFIQQTLLHTVADMANPAGSCTACDG